MSVRPRKLVLCALFVLAAFLIVVGVNGVRIGDYWLLLWAVFGIIGAFEVGRHFSKEKAILENPIECEGVVLERRRSTGFGRRRGYRIKYVLVAEDGKRYTGAARGTILLPMEGQPIALIYRRDDPAKSLPAGQFWFHEVRKRS